MSVADWDPEACEGQPALPQAEKEAVNTESDAIDTDAIDSDAGESGHPVEKPAIEPKRAIAGNGHPLHRLAEVRRQQGVSLRNMRAAWAPTYPAFCDKNKKPPTCR